MASRPWWGGLVPQMGPLGQSLLLPKHPWVLLFQGAWPWCGCRSRTWHRVPRRWWGSMVSTCRDTHHHHVLPQGLCSPPAQPRSSDAAPAGSGMPPEVLWEPQVVPCRASVPSPGTPAPPRLLGLTVQHGDGDGELEDRRPSLVLDRCTLQLGQESHTGTFPDSPPPQEVSQDLRVPGAAVPSSCPAGTNPWLFPTTKTLLEPPSCPELVPQHWSRWILRDWSQPWPPGRRQSWG